MSKTENSKSIVDKINELFEKDDNQFGGYSAMDFLRNSAPEDYNESRTDWSRLSEIADDMYFLLNDIKHIINNASTEEDNDD